MNYHKTTLIEKRQLLQEKILCKLALGAGVYDLRKYAKRQLRPRLAPNL